MDNARVVNSCSPYYPIFLNLKNRKSVVVGGGKVAERKIRGLGEKGAVITVVSPSLTPALETMAKHGQIRVEKRDYRPGDLEGAVIAIAATDNKAINHQIAQEGADRGILVNVVDDPEHSDFILPSVAQRGDVIIAISTSGRSPALARKLRTELEAYLDQEIGDVAVLVAEVREELLKQGKRVNGDSWQKYLDLPGLKSKVREGKFTEARGELITLLSADNE